MGLNFRKSFKIAPGIRLNVGKKGVSSVSIGGRGARVSVGKRGTRTTVGLPGTGLSYSTFKSNKSQSQPTTDMHIENFQNQRTVSFILGFGIFWMPYFFAWLTLRKGYSSKARWISFIWMFFVIALIAFD
ncbi:MULTISPECIES: DUF4236 domain-containing protein [unclassified Acinetobacter]|uniref:DUF4236 domain-containing protein n=1 Tax=unclassified Acinetobacter TaxID=196816 RepID=UPI0029341D72|nr:MULTISPECIES: DUF4236 domain-containing protein [unclassified Acinetobacter]WOE31983.1 DUF4236 domain-containing protein [Acinetobacter sp. SAAs470]WOE37451.1 DUF4236 domain-containing protein [Acinetobacter sp. SAAs474]